jgi:hypothetical protein
MEKGMDTIKANGKLKSMLSGCNYGDTISQIGQCVKDKDIRALKELQNLHQQHKQVGFKYADALNNSKIAAMRYSFVKQTTQVFSTQLSVKESESSTVSCFVNLDTKISWIGEDFQIVTGACLYYTPTWMICPCAWAAMQHVGWDIDKIENSHLFYHLWYHPPWNEALKSIQLSDYKDSPYYSSPISDPTSSNVMDTLICQNTEETMFRVNSQIFEKIDIYGNISEAQRIAKMRQHFHKLEKIAVKSVHSMKLAITSIIEITNRLGSLSLTSTNLNLHISAIDKARNHHLKYSLQNASALNNLKRKSESVSNGKLVSLNTSSKKKQSNCTICHDIFKMPQEVYSTHCGNSSKCPNNKNNTSSSSQLHVKVKLEPPTTNDSPNDTSNQSKDEYISNNSNNQNSTINNNDEESPTIIDNNDPSDKDSDSDDDSSAYTNAHTFDEYSLKWMDRKQSNEPIHPGDVIEYYNPIGVFGDKIWLCHARVDAVDPINSYMPLVLNNAEGIPSITKVKCICILKDDIVVDHPGTGIFRSLDQFKMKKQGKTTMLDVMSKKADVFKGIVKKCIKQEMEKCRTERGLACSDIFHIRYLVPMKKSCQK